MDSDGFTVRGPKPNVEALLADIRRQFADTPLAVSEPLVTPPSVFDRTPLRHAEWIDVVIKFGTAVAPVIAKEVIEWAKKRAIERKVTIEDKSTKDA